MGRKLRQFDMALLDAVLRSKGWSDERLANEVYLKTKGAHRVTTGAISGWRRGARPSIDTAEILCWVLGVTRDDITSPVEVPAA